MTYPVVITDLQDASFYTLDLYRPVSEFRYGGLSLRERMSKLVGKDNVYYYLKDGYMANILKERAGTPTNEVPPNKEFLVISSRLMGSLDELNSLIKFLSSLEPGGILVNNQNKFIGGKLTRDNFPDMKRNIKLYKQKTLSVPYVNYPWSFLDKQPSIIKDDVLNKHFRQEFSVLKPARGNWPVLAHKDGVYIERYTYIDTRQGPVIIHSNVEIQSFTRVSGPSVIREDSFLMSALIRENTTIGPVCKIGGEVADSLIDGFSNQAHKSYVGHSYVGQWVNIGAFTVTSDLKNTYGEIKLDHYGEKISTKKIKIGAFIGDYVKTSISTSIMGGKIIGCFSQVMGPVYRSIPPFTIWNGYKGKLYESYIESIIYTQQRMYARRRVAQLDIEKTFIERLFQQTAYLRKEAKKERFKW